MRLIKGRIAGFTLIEILMVVMILGLLAGIIMPNFSSQQEQVKIATTKANLESLRTAIALFCSQENQWPQDDLLDLSNGASPSGNVYLKEIPEEALSDSNTVYPMSFPDGAGGWQWDTGMHELHPNLIGLDANGLAYSAY